MFFFQLKKKKNTSNEFVAIGNNSIENAAQFRNVAGYKIYRHEAENSNNLNYFANVHQHLYLK